MGEPLFGGKQRYAELRPALEPGARAVARLLEKIVHRFEDGEYAPGADRIAHGERSARVAQAERHGAVEVGGARDAHLHDVAADVDNVCDHPLGDEAWRILDDA